MKCHKNSLSFITPVSAILERIEKWKVLQFDFSEMFSLKLMSFIGPGEFNLSVCGKIYVT